MRRKEVSASWIDEASLAMRGFAAGLLSHFLLFGARAVWPISAVLLKRSFRVAL
jgi:hypothetical protein